LPGWSETGSYSVLLLDTVAVGTLANSTQSAITGPVAFDNENSNYMVSYAPPAGVWGDNFASFSVQVVDAHGVSNVTLITINVYHVDKAPVVVPYEYTTEDTTVANFSSVTINENEPVVIVFNISDVDTPPSNLTLQIFSIPFSGVLYQYSATLNAAGTNLGTAIKFASTWVPVSDDGLWRVVYVPASGASGIKLGSFTVQAYDGVLYSARFTTSITVNKVNQPPSILVKQYNWTTLAESSVVITGVSIYDSDAGFNDLLFTLSIVDSSGKPVKTGPFLNLTNYDPTDCHFTEYTINCTATLDKLNAILTQIAFVGPNAGNYHLVVFVDDLGDGANANDRATSHLTASASLNISCTAVAVVQTSHSANTNVLTAIIAASSAGGAAAVVGVWQVLKRRRPPVTDFFGADDFKAVIETNPLYDQAGGFATNSLYEMPHEDDLVE